jgi:hypothetical protein
MVIPDFTDYLKLRAMPNRPKTFFKYMTVKVAKIVLVNYTLRWSSPLLFNDPFDVQRNFSLGFDFEELKEPLLNELKKLISSDSIPDLSSKPHIERFVNRMRRNPNIQNIVFQELPQWIEQDTQSAERGACQNMKKKWSELVPQFRILSLSAINDNPLMWSHYSDSHRGVVLELQGINHLDSPWLIAQPVTYQDSPPMAATKQEWIKSITGQKRLNHDKWQFYAPYTLTKTTDWEYEKEWRVVSFMRPGESGLYADYPFNPPEVRSVYLGCEISDEDSNDIISLLNYDLSHVRAYRAKKLERERKLSFEKIK